MTRYIIKKLFAFLAERLVKFSQRSLAITDY